jgi:predicted secreted protein with PEFG-CTERM motif
MGISSVGNMPVMSMVKGTVRDGSTQVVITYSPAFPASGQLLTMTLSFADAKGNLIQHQNYALSVIQDGNEVFSNSTGHTHTGNDMQTTNNLQSSSPVDIRVTLNGVGLPGTDPSTWTGPKGDALGFHVVPEFGPVASLIMAISIIGIVVISRKFRFHF